MLVNGVFSVRGSSAARALRLRPELPEHFIRVITAGHQSLGCPAGRPQRCGEEGL